MKLLDIQAAIGTAILLLALPCESSSHAQHLDHPNIIGKRHQHHHRRSPSSSQAAGESGLSKRGTCTFPTGKGLVAVTPDAQNAGWAMSPDQTCGFDSFCPYACPPGQVMAQWNPDAKNYPDPKSMDGGLYCNKNGEVILPFSDRPYCVDGTKTVGAKNECKKKVAFCQTVLPGNEAMIIPTEVDNWAQIAIPNADYWLSTAAHYYVNFPGYSTAEACIWGDGNKPLGNWSPYVAGGNTKADGSTFSMISWNPIYLDSWHKKTTPSFGIKIECVSGNCLGLPCSIDPTKDGIGGVTSGQVGSGADNVKFCVVTVPQGAKANIVTFPVGGSDEGDDDTVSETTKKPEAAVKAASTTKAEPSSTKETTSTTTEAKTTTSKETSSSTAATTSKTANFGNILFEKTNQTSTSTIASTTKASVTSATRLPAASPTDKQSSANAVSGSMFGLFVVFAAAIYIL